MNKQFLHMQKLAGLITESQYKKLLEDQSTVDRILDKISAKGLDSLTDEEKEYLDTDGKSVKPLTGNIIVYVSKPFVELYKIENFPAVPNAKSINFDCDDDVTTCENYPEMVEMLKNKNFKLVLNKIKKEEDNQSYEPLYFHGIDFDGDFSSPIDVAYAYASNDGYLYIVDSLSRFESKTEKDWKVKNWKKL
jgi:hypothetical protein